MADSSDRTEGSGSTRVSARTVIAILVVVLLVVLVVLNSQTVELHLIFTTVHWPLWLILAVVILLSLGVGYVLGNQHAKARRR